MEIVERYPDLKTLGSVERRKALFAKIVADQGTSVVMGLYRSFVYTIFSFGLGASFVIILAGFMRSRDRMRKSLDWMGLAKVTASCLGVAVVFYMIARLSMTAEWLPIVLMFAAAPFCAAASWLQRS